MRKLQAILLSLVLVLGLFPMATVWAEENTPAVDLPQAEVQGEAKAEDSSSDQQVDAAKPRRAPVRPDIVEIVDPAQRPAGYWKVEIKAGQGTDYNPGNQAKAYWVKDGVVLPESHYPALYAIGGYDPASITWTVQPGSAITKDYADGDAILGNASLKTDSIIDITDAPDTAKPGDNYHKVTIDAGEGARLKPGQVKKIYYVKDGVGIPADRYPQTEATEGYKADTLHWTVDPDTQILGDVDIKSVADPYWKDYFTYSTEDLIKEFGTATTPHEIYEQIKLTYKKNGSTHKVMADPDNRVSLPIGNNSHAWMETDAKLLPDGKRPGPYTVNVFITFPDNDAENHSRQMVQVTVKVKQAPLSPTPEVSVDPAEQRVKDGTAISPVHIKVLNREPGATLDVGTLPAGLTLNQQDGSISGIITGINWQTGEAERPFTIDVTITNPDHSKMTKTITIKVFREVPPAPPQPNPNQPNGNQSSQKTKDPLFGRFRSLFNPRLYPQAGRAGQTTKPTLGTKPNPSVGVDSARPKLPKTGEARNANPAVLLLTAAALGLLVLHQKRR